MSESTERSPLTTSSLKRPTWAQIDLDALASNFHLVKKCIGSDVRVMAVVKANGYGHGAVACAHRLAKEGVDWFGVALPEEGVKLRESGISQPILCLAGFWGDQADLLIKHQLTPAVYRRDVLESLDRLAADRGVVIDVHVKVDTGMGRLGVRHDAVSEYIEFFKSFKNIRMTGLMTHFAAADEPSCGLLTQDQIQRFQTTLENFRQHGFNPTLQHLANSAGIFGQPSAHGNMVRPGGVLYGLWRDVLDPEHRNENFHPVMSLHSRITLLKWVPAGETVGYGCTFEASSKTLVATVPIGYDDGYMRVLSNRGRVLVRGVPATVIGRISMDLTLVDVTNVPGVQVDDEVILMGRKDGVEISAEELAKMAGTLSYEVTCGIGSRVPRVFVTTDDR